MTVQELIDELMKIENKAAPVIMSLEDERVDYVQYEARYFYDGEPACVLR